MLGPNNNKAIIRFYPYDDHQDRGACQIWKVILESRHCVYLTTLQLLIFTLAQTISNSNSNIHGLRTPGEEIAFTAWPKIKSQSQIFRYGRSIFCLPHRPNFSDIFDLCLHWVSVVRVPTYIFWSLHYQTGN